MPIYSQPVRLRLGKGKKICVIIPDETRGCPTKEILSPVLQEIESCKPKKIELLIGNGLHRGMSKEEMMESLGKDIVEKYNKIEDKNKQNQYNLLLILKAKNKIKGNDTVKKEDEKAI